MNRVIFLARTDKDVSGAEAFGDLVFLLDRAPSPLNPDALIEPVQQRLHEIDFDPDEDCIAMTGPPVQLAIFLSVVMSMFEWNINLIIFDATTGSYKRRSLELDHA